MSGVPEDDEIISTLPIHYSNALAPDLQLHQFPLLNRPLHVPPSAAQSGKQITSRMKLKVRKLEIHVPADTRPDVWNKEKGSVLGQARIQDDKEKNQALESQSSGEPRLSEVRLKSDMISHKGVHMLGIVRDGHLHLHPIDETHQLRPNLTYLDVMNRKNRRGGAGDDSDSDDGPPPDPDEPAPALPPPKKDKKKSQPEAKEVTVSVRRTTDSNGPPGAGGMSAARREILRTLHQEEDDEWQDLEFRDVTVILALLQCRPAYLKYLQCSKSSQSAAIFEKVFSTSGKELVLTSDMTSYLKDIPGL
ncbi:Sin-like protein conserved region-domain-containing protein [Flagelloscypha sp. PMI_526]|nr:Sin-like protein conserved region-domain-containing protein [Flagelloscypha sp. PMI_526]